MRSLKMQITYLLVLFVGVVILAAPSFADYYNGPKYVPKPLYSKPPQVEKPIPVIRPPKIPWVPKPKLPKLPKPKVPRPRPHKPPPPPRKRLPPPYRHYPGHPPVENAHYIKPNN
ncbi:hypothetical protein SADUNF_Sadunf10G0037300 [Salix dunnii]|uniref:Uncharacterized protein n=1 Tax=Salix dunnii TaxID=1413687 RepID=A0A835MQ26_9ROSI|nr:hypothetical protein SADUNF_Sadunf10G0037300 [Salix dunnii]